VPYSPPLDRVRILALTAHWLAIPSGPPFALFFALFPSGLELSLFFVADVCLLVTLRDYFDMLSAVHVFSFFYNALLLVLESWT
jgi:hypothetical protein